MRKTVERISLFLTVALVSAIPLSSVLMPLSQVGDHPGLVSAQRQTFILLTTQNIRFAPDSFNVNPGDDVRVRITQAEALMHTFTLAKEKDRVLPSDWTAPQLDEYFVNNNLTDVGIPATVGAIVWANFTAPSQVGRYEFVCLIPGHFQGGMLGFLQVGEPAAPGLSSLGFAAIVVGVVVVVVVAAAFAVRMKRKRQTKPPVPPAP